jgi:predicted transposase YdaD
MEQPASDFDGAWKYALEQYFAAFLELFFPEAFAAIDWQKPVIYQDTELQQIAPEDQTGKQRADKLIKVQRRDGKPALVLVHVEVQSQHDSEFSERMFRYHARLYDRERIPVVSLAILGDEQPAWEPAQFGYDIWGCRLSLDFPIAKLLKMDTNALRATRNPFASLVLIHRDAQETRTTPDERVARKVARYRALLRQGYAVEDIRILLRLFEHILRLDPERALLARDVMRQVEQEETGMDTFVTSFEEIGREEGLKEGREEGKRELVLRLLARKVGPLSSELQERIAALTPNHVLELGDALLEFTIVADLTNWLDRQQH